MSTVTHSHVEVRSNGKAYIAGTGFKVRVLAEEHLATGADAPELQAGHPDLTLGQIHSALAFYYDHKDEFDLEIEKLNRLATEMRAEQGESLFARKLRAVGKELP